MTTAKPDYPQPVEDTDNRTYLAAWRDGTLKLQHCRGCGKASFYPRDFCAHCWSTGLEWRKASGTGEIVAFSKIHRPNHQSFNAEVPVVLAEVRLAEGATMLARIIGDQEKVASSAKVELIQDGWQARGLPLPAFRLIKT